MNKELFRFSARSSLLARAISTACAAIVVLASGTAFGLELNWSGQFRAETHWIYNYSLDTGNTQVDVAKVGKGYYVPGGGKKNAFFQEAFLRLRPSVVVNDNIYLKSEWWVGDPVYGLFGSTGSLSTDQNSFYSTGNRGSSITAQRFWAELLTDVGTVQVGRAPLHWGLGIVWNAGNGVWDRYMSTGDVVRLVSKFGAFSFVPSAVKYSTGHNVGGACVGPAATPCSQTNGDGTVVDYSVMLKYENLDQDVEMGVNFIRRLGGASQDTLFGYDGTPQGMAYNTYDLYGRKKLGPVRLGAEVPIVSGTIGSAKYSAFAFAAEADWQVMEALAVNLRAGQAPGQPNSTGAPDTFKAMHFHPGYKLGMFMFNYQFANFAGPNAQNGANAVGAASLASPYDNPIVNARYLSVGAGYALGKWKLRTQWTFATALESAEAGKQYYNTWRRKFEAATQDQDDSLGWEMTYGTTFQWDESFQFLLDFGWYFPGAYYEFAGDAATGNSVSSVFGTTFKVGVNF
ncbi:MAG: hypothetical protein IT285_00475 [Bdellovibrionales bacterium]|nr:hypothetical protein [Bdellovibrionales bacterium]